MLLTRGFQGAEGFSLLSCLTAHTFCYPPLIKFCALSFTGGFAAPQPEETLPAFKRQWPCCFMTQSFMGWWPWKWGKVNCLTFVCFQISTNKERHSRLGEDNLDDTLECDFSGPPLRAKDLEELQMKYDVLLLEPTHEVKAQTDSVLMNPVTPLVSSSQGCGASNPCISYLNAADVPARKDSVESVKDKAE